jgi:phosphoserine phosphatase
MTRVMQRTPPRRAAAVVFDCDSTLSAIEGIDELAAGCRDEVSALTDAAMRGVVPLEAVYGRRLELIRPTRHQLQLLAARYVEMLVPDAVALVHALLAEGIAVRIISGGLRPAVLAVAHALGLDDAMTAAVDIRFDERDQYAGYDTASPLARAGGKLEVMTRWRAEIGVPLLLVGDGATDLEAAGAADTFVAYAGVVDRPEVTANADVVIRSASLAPVLPLALAGAAPRSVQARALHERGMQLLDTKYHSFLHHAGD